MGRVCNFTYISYSMILTETDNESICKALQSDDTINGISSKTISAPDTDIMALKAYLKEQEKFSNDLSKKSFSADVAESRKEYIFS